MLGQPETSSLIQVQSTLFCFAELFNSFILTFVF